MSIERPNHDPSATGQLKSLEYKRLNPWVIDYWLEIFRHLRAIEITQEECTALVEFAKTRVRQ